MKKQISIAVVALLLFSAIPGFPADIGQNGDNRVQSQAPVEVEYECGNHLSRMQDRMKMMQEQMDKIRGARNPQERQKLFEAHWETMQQSMGMMDDLYGRCMRGGMMMGGPMRHRGMTEGMMMGGQMPPGADPAQLPEPESVGAKLVGRYCTQCHGLPTPNLHTTEGWPPVVQRMNTRMQWMTENSRLPIQAPTASEVQSITEYLQKKATP